MDSDKACREISVAQRHKQEGVHRHEATMAELHADQSHNTASSTGIGMHLATQWTSSTGSELYQLTQ